MSHRSNFGGSDWKWHGTDPPQLFQVSDVSVTCLQWLHGWEGVGWGVAVGYSVGAVEVWAVPGGCQWVAPQLESGPVTTLLWQRLADDAGPGALWTAHGGESPGRRVWRLPALPSSPALVARRVTGGTLQPVDGPARVVAVVPLANEACLTSREDSVTLSRALVLWERPTDCWVELWDMHRVEWENSTAFTVWNGRWPAWGMHVDPVGVWELEPRSVSSEAEQPQFPLTVGSGSTLIRLTVRPAGLHTLTAALELGENEFPNWRTLRDSWGGEESEWLTDVAQRSAALLSEAARDSPVTAQRWASQRLAALHLEASQMLRSLPRHSDNARQELAAVLAELAALWALPLPSTIPEEEPASEEMRELLKNWKEAVAMVAAQVTIMLTLLRLGALPEDPEWTQKLRERSQQRRGILEKHNEETLAWDTLVEALGPAGKALGPYPPSLVDLVDLMASTDSHGLVAALVYQLRDGDAATGSNWAAAFTGPAAHLGRALWQCDATLLGDDPMVPAKLPVPFPWENEPTTLVPVGMWRVWAREHPQAAAAAIRAAALPAEKTLPWLLTASDFAASWTLLRRSADSSLRETFWEACLSSGNEKMLVQLPWTEEETEALQSFLRSRHSEENKFSAIAAVAAAQRHHWGAALTFPPLRSHVMAVLPAVLRQDRVTLRGKELSVDSLARPPVTPPEKKSQPTKLSKPEKRQTSKLKDVPPAAHLSPRRIVGATPLSHTSLPRTTPLSHSTPLSRTPLSLRKVEAKKEHSPPLRWLVSPPAPKSILRSPGRTPRKSVSFSPAPQLNLDLSDTSTEFPPFEPNLRDMTDEMLPESPPSPITIEPITLSEPIETFTPMDTQADKEEEEEIQTRKEQEEPEEQEEEEKQQKDTQMEVEEESESEKEEPKSEEERESDEEVQLRRSTRRKSTELLSPSPPRLTTRTKISPSRSHPMQLRSTRKQRR